MLIVIDNVTLHVKRQHVYNHPKENPYWQMSNQWGVQSSSHETDQMVFQRRWLVRNWEGDSSWLWWPVVNIEIHGRWTGCHGQSSKNPWGMVWYSFPTEFRAPFPLRPLSFMNFYMCIFVGYYTLIYYYYILFVIDYLFTIIIFFIIYFLLLSFHYFLLFIYHYYFYLLFIIYLLIF